MPGAARHHRLWCGAGGAVDRGVSQAAQGRIVTTAHGIYQGAIPDLSRLEGDSDFYFVSPEDPETAAAWIVELVKTRIPKRFGLDAMQDSQVLCR